jgi:carboxylesterase type B
VRANAAKFGGDADAVTVFGESAGGRSVDFLLVAPEPGAALFRAAIVQSGSAALSPGSLAAGDPAGGAAAAQRAPLLVSLARAVGCGGEGWLACVRKAPVAKVMEAIRKEGLNFQASDDGGRTTARDAEGARARGLAARASVMIGTTAEELKGTMRGGSESNGTLAAYVARRFPREADLQKKVAEAYKVGPGGKAGFATEFDAIAKLATDMEFTCVTSREAKSSAAGGYRAHLPSSSMETLN